MPVHSQIYRKEPEETGVTTCYFNRSSEGNSRMVGAWLSSDAYEWVWDRYQWYTRISTGGSFNDMPMMDVLSNTVIPEEQAAIIRSRFTVGKIEEPWNGGIQVHWICETVATQNQIS